MYSIRGFSLTGFLISKKAKEKGINKVIVDTGLYRSTKGSKIYAVIKGAFDYGLDIKFKENIIPSIERIEGKHTKQANNIVKKLNEIKELIKKWV